MIDVLVVVARLATYVGMAILGGGLLFLALAWPGGYRSPRLITFLRRSLDVAFVATFVTLVLHGPDVTGRGLGATVDPALISSAAGTQFGATVIGRLIVLVLIGLLLRRGLNQPVTGLRVAVSIALLVPTLAATMTFSGHAMEKGSFVVACDMLHLTAASVWLGGLVVLVFVLLPAERKEELAVAVPAFSTLAFGSVVILAITGGIHGLIRLGSVGALFSHEYGRLLLFKMVVFATLLGFGAMSHRWTQRRFSRKLDGRPVSDAEFRRGIRRTAGTEVGIGFAVLAVTAVLVATNPPALETEHPPGQVDHVAHTSA